MAGRPAAALGRAAPEGRAEAALVAAPPELAGVLEEARLADEVEADEAAPAAEEEAEAEDMLIMDDRVVVTPVAEEVPLSVAEPEPVVVIAPVVATPEVEALELRQALDDPGWIVRAEFPTETPVESVIKSVTEVPAAMLTTQVYGLDVRLVLRVSRAAALGWPPGTTARMNGAVPPVQDTATGWHWTRAAGVAMEKVFWASAVAASETAMIVFPNISTER